ncbi:MAG: LysM peptidoglycan-binding domain-containing protein [Frankiaceae bacterium]|nr:LysM peptidoglycan-binding domain-containing protein [Frankiaceae bacterium]MBV9871577.1 LysM peptidoglycan-binding domain-containing protein [Frankiaceae bacterium]
MATVRLTRRGRIVLVLAVMLMLVIAGFVLGQGSGQAAGHPRQAQHTLIMQRGESLWAVAARVAPHQDPRLVVADIESLNHLSSAAVTPGQQLVIPTYP